MKDTLEKNGPTVAPKRTDPMYHPIDEDKAATLISAFLNHESLQNIGTDYAIGGLVDLKNNSITFLGTVFWYCWNVNSPISGLPKFFLAYEDNKPYESGKPHEVEINSETLKRTADYTFKYPNNIPRTIAEVKKFLEKPVKEWTDTKRDDYDISAEDVARLTYNFKHHFKEINVPNAFNTYPFGFFVSDEFKEIFLAQGDYVRYYFGYDINSEVNKIKIILAAVTSDGKNVYEPGEVFFEQSWPPEPVNRFQKGIPISVEIKKPK